MPAHPRVQPVSLALPTAQIDDWILTTVSPVLTTQSGFASHVVTADLATKWPVASSISSRLPPFMIMRHIYLPRFSQMDPHRDQLNRRLMRSQPWQCSQRNPTNHRDEVKSAKPVGGLRLVGPDPIISAIRIALAWPLPGILARRRPVCDPADIFLKPFLVREMTMLYTVASVEWSEGSPLSPGQTRLGLFRTRAEAMRGAVGRPTLAVAVCYDSARGVAVAQSRPDRGLAPAWSGPAIEADTGGVTVLAAIPADLVRVVGPATIRVHAPHENSIPDPHRWSE